MKEREGRERGEREGRNDRCSALHDHAWCGVVWCGGEGERTGSHPQNHTGPSAAPTHIAAEEMNKSSLFDKGHRKISRASVWTMFNFTEHQGPLIFGGQANTNTKQQTNLYVSSEKSKLLTHRASSLSEVYTLLETGDF